MDSQSNESFLTLVENKIELDKLIYNLPKVKQNKVKYLLEKRNQIRKSNKLFAEYRINHINKKINKITKAQ